MAIIGKVGNRIYKFDSEEDYNQTMCILENLQATYFQEVLEKCMADDNIKFEQLKKPSQN